MVEMLQNHNRNTKQIFVKFREIFQKAFFWRLVFGRDGWVGFGVWLAEQHFKERLLGRLIRLRNFSAQCDGHIANKSVVVILGCMVEDFCEGVGLFFRQ